MNVAADTLEARIGDGWLIGVPDGSYTLTVKQTITPQGDVEHDVSRDFTVNITGPRFAINSGDLHSRFPAPDSTGSYAALLPQAVLARATLPWERTLTGSVDVEEGFVGQSLSAPFVALIVCGGPTPPPVVACTVGDMINPPSGVFRPPLTLGPSERLTDASAYVELTVAQYKETLPTAADLPYLAHIREVDASAKASGEATDDGWYAVVLANRLPAAASPGMTAPSTAYLVSLEGYGPYLPLTASTFPNGCASTRLVVLTSWTFSDDGVGAQDFTETLTAASKRSGGLVVGAPGDGTAAAAALRRGYVPMNHVTRQAQTVVAWYRGPLVPLSMPAEAPRSYSCSDAALRFDPATGMLDCTYAAAWQLGRLMALADQEVAQAIDGWRRADRQRAGDLVGRVLLARRFPSLGLEPTVAGLLGRQAVRRSFASVLAREIGPAAIGGRPAEHRISGPRDSLLPADEQVNLRRRLRADPDHWLGLAAAQDPPLPDLVLHWLAKLSALDGLPFNHLVPDPRALPTESIRFFYLDPTWIAALVDGALSIGRTTTFDHEHDAAVLPLAVTLAIRARTRLRSGAGAPAAATELGTGPVSGFLLRSRAVTHWSGVDVTVYPDALAQKPALPLIRLERLSDTVLLCLAQGSLARVDFRQPIEGLQLGIRGASDLSVTLRGLGQGGFAVGATLGAGSLQWRGDATDRVIDVAGSAAALAAALVQDKAWTAGQALSPGDFAMQILESAQVVSMATTTMADLTPAQPAWAPTPEDLLDRGSERLQSFIDRGLLDAR